MKLITLLVIDSIDLKNSFYLEFFPFFPKTTMPPIIFEFPDILYQIYLNSLKSKWKK